MTSGDMTSRDVVLLVTYVNQLEKLVGEHLGNSSLEHAVRVASAETSLACGHNVEPLDAIEEGAKIKDILDCLPMAVDRKLEEIKETLECREVFTVYPKELFILGKSLAHYHQFLYSRLDNPLLESPEETDLFKELQDLTQIQDRVLMFQIDRRITKKTVNPEKALTVTVPN